MQALKYAGCSLPGVFRMQRAEPIFEAACADNIEQRRVHD
jgi:hypothetical protein